MKSKSKKEYSPNKANDTPARIWISTAKNIDTIKATLTLNGEKKTKVEIVDSAIKMLAKDLKIKLEVA